MVPQFRSVLDKPAGVAGVFSLVTLLAAACALWAPAFAADKTPAIRHEQHLDTIYRARDHRPLWTADDGHLNRAGWTFLNLLKHAEREGLRPQDYHVQALTDLAAPPDPGTPFLPLPADYLIESLLTDAFLAFGLDLSLGRIDPGLIFSRWENDPELAETVAVLVADLVNAPNGWDEPGFDPAATLARVRPDHFGYRTLQEALAYYHWVDRVGGWAPVPPGETLRPGERNPRVGFLRKRLLGLVGPETWLPTSRPKARAWNWFAGVLPVPVRAADPDFFDAELEAAVRSFQKRHGLTSDGLVGKYTLAALNETAAHKAARIVLNLERIRWLPDEPTVSFIRVNIPSCRLDLMEGGRSVLSMKTVVGRPDRPTPVMQDVVRWLELNPYWNVPQKLVREDILPKVVADSLYLTDRAFTVFEDWKRGAPEIDIAAVDWAQVDTLNLSYRFRQDPGPRNPLGRMKFLFPNKFSVYLHDTNQKEHFYRENRALSSGCIRLEDPDSLARLLVPEQDFDEVLESGEHQSLGLAERIPIFIVYQTTWIDDGGRVNFAPDIYGYDARMLRIMAGEEAKVLVAN